MQLRTCFFWLCLMLFAHANVHAAPFEDSMAQRTRACTACHGLQGRAGPDGYYPRLAGKPAQYLYNQLLNIRAGRRHYPLMAGLLDSLDESYMHAIAEYFAALQVPYPAPAKALAADPAMEHGRRLVQDGNAVLGIPACTQCHGTLLMGVNPATPGLLGLPADYINAQLGGWQSGQRHASEPDCMAKIAKRLSPSDASDIARWLAAQPVPANVHAAQRKPSLNALNASNAPNATTAAFQCGSDTSVQATAPAAKGASSAGTAPDAVERGRYLAHIGNCAHCHSARGGMAYAGGRVIDTPFGTVVSSNITSDPEHGLGSWTSEDFWHALHEGIARDGHALYPAFPYTSYTHLSRADADDLWAFLKTVPASTQARQDHSLRWPYNTQTALTVWRALFFKPDSAAAQGAGATHAGAGAAVEEPTAAWLRGKYLVQGPGHCMECHGARNALGALSSDPLAGGAVLPGDLWFAPALNDPNEASVAAWSNSELATFLQTGRNRSAHASGPMAEVVLHGTQYLSANDAQAMAVYLKSLPQRAALAPTAAAQASSTVLQRGSKLYDKHCSDCHGEQGQGQPGAYPALAGNRNVTQTLPNNLINTVLAGGFAAATPGHAQPFGMPPFTLQLSDADIAAVLSHIRNAWGNHAAAVSEFDINKFRRSKAP